MELTLFEIHLDDVAFATGTGDSETATPTETIEEEPGTDGVPRVALALVPIFLGLGVAAGFLAARRLRRRETPTPDAEYRADAETGPDTESIDVEVDAGVGDH